MADKLCFVSVEFVNDPNVVGLTYWYLCDFAAVKSGDRVVAPLGRHNHTQTGVVRRVLFETEADAPYPIRLIKRIQSVVGEKENV